MLVQFHRKHMGRSDILEPLKSRRCETERIVLTHNITAWHYCWGFCFCLAFLGSVLVMFLIKEEVQIHSPFLVWKPVSNTGKCQLTSCCLRRNQKHPHESRDHLADCLRPSTEWGCGPWAPLTSSHLSLLPISPSQTSGIPH